MRKRLAKKIEKMRRKKIHEALEMVLEINTTQRREWSITRNKPTAFFDFSGHTAGVSVDICPDGWYSGCKRLQYYSWFSNRTERNVDQLLKELANKKKELQDAGKM